VKPSHSFPAPDSVDSYVGTTVHPPNGRLNDLAIPPFTLPIDGHLADGNPTAERPPASVRVALTGSHRPEWPIYHVIAYHVHNEAALEGTTMHAIAAIPSTRRDLPATGRVRPRNIMRKTGVVSRARTIAEAQPVWMTAGLLGASE
jgi:hypothetical protein